MVFSRANRRVYVAQTKAKAWTIGIAATVISNFSTAALSALAMPEVFNFTHEGKIHLLKILAIPTATHLFLYLRKSPWPGVTIAIEPGDTASAQNVSVASDGTVTADSITIAKASEPETK